MVAQAEGMLPFPASQGFTPALSFNQVILSGLQKRSGIEFIQPDFGRIVRGNATALAHNGQTQVVRQGRPIGDGTRFAGGIFDIVGDEVGDFAVLLPNLVVIHIFRGSAQGIANGPGNETTVHRVEDIFGNFISIPVASS